MNMSDKLDETSLHYVVVHTKQRKINVTCQKLESSALNILLKSTNSLR